MPQFPPANRNDKHEALTAKRSRDRMKRKDNSLARSGKKDVDQGV